jgi:hypothetical protein
MSRKCLYLLNSLVQSLKLASNMLFNYSKIQEYSHNRLRDYDRYII